ncbi:MAG: hypothetical protein ACJ789_00320 [Thermomicrobiales bacterium]
MRVDLLDSKEPSRTIGAAVVRAQAGGGIVLDLGPADGPPQIRLLLSHSEALQLGKSVRAIANDGGEAVLIVEE